MTAVRRIIVGGTARLCLAFALASLLWFIGVRTSFVVLGFSGEYLIAGVAAGVILESVLWWNHRYDF